MALRLSFCPGAVAGGLCIPDMMSQCSVKLLLEAAFLTAIASLLHEEAHSSDSEGPHCVLLHWRCSERALSYWPFLVRPNRTGESKIDVQGTLITPSILCNDSRD